MMSLSNNNDQFQPMAIHTLEQLDEESNNNKINELDPDFDRFKLLFDEPKFKENEALDFKAMYEFKKEQEDVVFKPLIERNEDKGEDQKPVPDEETEPEVPELTPEEKGFQEGFEKGLEEGTAQGLAQGKEQGHKEGFKKGEEEGLKKGESEGFEKGHAQGTEQGVEEGEQKGETQAKEAAEQFLIALEETLKTADQTLDLIVDKYEEGIISLIQQIAQKTIMAKIQIDDEIVKPMILEALKTLVQPEQIILSVSLDDYEYIEMIKDEFFEQVDSLTSVSVRSDPSLSKASFNIETNTAMLSSDVESKLDEIFESVKTVGRQ